MRLIKYRKLSSGHFRENAHSVGNFMIQGDPMENFSHKNDHWSHLRESREIRYT